MPSAYKVVLPQDNQLVSSFASAVSGKQKIYAIDTKPQLVNQGFVFKTIDFAKNTESLVLGEQIWECEYDAQIPFPKIRWAFTGYLRNSSDAKNTEILEYIAQIEETLEPYKFIDGVEYGVLDKNWDEVIGFGILHVSNILLTNQVY